MNNNLKMKDFYNTNITKNPDFIHRQLKSLQNLLSIYEDEIYEALLTDLGKSKSESFLTEIGITNSELEYHLSHPIKNKRVRTPLSLQLGKSEIINEPYGNVLIIVPFNYPLQLCFVPLIAAIAAGNVVNILLSDKLEAINKLYLKMFSHFSNCYLNYLGQDYLIVNEMKFDFIFFTGSNKVGKLIANKAIQDDSEYCLELGGKSPCIVTKTTNLKLAAKKIVWGKLVNSGQTCVAVDYLMIDKSLTEEFIELMKSELITQHQNLNNPDYPKLVSESALARMLTLLDEQHYQGGETSNSKMNLAFVLNPSLESKLMKEEIFGPILPIIEFQNIDECFDYIKENDKPLAAYLFSNDPKEIVRMKTEISAGSIAINDCVIHLANPYLPFGGVNSSGTGKYHHQYSTELFSHAKAVYTSKNPFELPFRYQPYSKLKDSIIKRLI